MSRGTFESWSPNLLGLSDLPIGGRRFSQNGYVDQTEQETGYATASSSISEIKLKPAIIESMMP